MKVKGRLVFRPSETLEMARKMKRLLRGSRMGKTYIRKTSSGYGVFEKIR